MGCKGGSEGSATSPNLRILVEGCTLPGYVSRTIESGRILTLPNLVSFARLLGVGVFWWLLLHDHITAAAWFVIVIGWSDWVDGYLARRLNQVSRLGAALDPLADRLMIFSAVVGGLIFDVIPAWIAVPLLIREAVMLGVTAVLVLAGKGILEVRYIGKVATFILYAAIPAFYLAAGAVAPSVMTALGWSLGLVGLVLYWYVACLYIGDAYSRIRGVKSSDPTREPNAHT